MTTTTCEPDIDDDQYHGLCAVCGERVDYGQDDHNRETDNHLDCDGIFD